MMEPGTFARIVRSPTVYSTAGRAPILYVAVGGLYVACSKVNSGSVAPGVIKDDGERSDNRQTTHPL
jgi:hypothetical protein